MAPMFVVGCQSIQVYPKLQVLLYEKGRSSVITEEMVITFSNLYKMRRTEIFVEKQQFSRKRVASTCTITYELQNTLQREYQGKWVLPGT
jgi:hypothetical protein